MLLLLLLLVQAPDARDLSVRMAGMTAITGYEQSMADSVAALLPGSVRDRAGNVVLKVGTGAPLRLAICPLDEPGYVVGAMRPDGYLTLHRVPGRVPPMADQQLEGQPVTVWGRRGPVPAVVAVRSVHLTRGRTAADEPFTADNAYVDLGASSSAEADSLGVRLLNPVALAKHPHRYGDSLLAAPVAGRRAACAALIFAALAAKPHTGTTVYGFVVQQNLDGRGALTMAHQYGRPAETLLVDGAPGAPGAPVEAADSSSARAATFGRGLRLSITTRYGGTPVETIALPDVSRLGLRLRRWIEEGQ